MTWRDQVISGLPPDHHLGELQRDYRAMQAMLFGIVPDFNEIISGLGNLENKINSLSTPRS